jgi:phosphohistidine phosphatase
MKTLLLIRHAKSSWDSPGANDFDRPLNERGQRNAPDMAQRLARKEIKLDLMLSSPAVRAKQTAILFAQGLGYDSNKIQYVDGLYLAGLRELLMAIGTAAPEADTIAIVGHNPGITEFANTLTSVRIDNMPTASVFAVQSDCSQWREFVHGKKEFLFFDYPKSQV